MRPGPTPANNAKRPALGRLPADALWRGSAIKSTRVLSNRLKLTLLPRRIPVDDRPAALVTIP